VTSPACTTQRLCQGDRASSALLRCKRLATGSIAVPGARHGKLGSPITFLEADRLVPRDCTSLRARTVCAEVILMSSGRVADKCTDGHRSTIYKLHRVADVRSSGS
jgi:hypothetical protein